MSVACAFSSLVKSEHAVVVIRANNIHTATPRTDAHIYREHPQQLAPVQSADGGSKVLCSRTYDSSSSDFIHVEHSDTADSMYNDGWEGIEMPMNSPGAHSSSLNDIARALMKPLFTHSEIDVDTGENGWNKCEGWRAKEWFEESEIAQVRRVFGVDRPRQRVRVFYTDDVHGDTTSCTNFQSRAIAVVEGTTLCRVSVQGLIHQPVVLPPTLDFSDEPLTHANAPCGTRYEGAFEVAKLHMWLTSSSSDQSAVDTSGCPVGVDIYVCTDLYAFNELANESTTGEGTQAWCAALTTSLGLDSTVYTIMLDTDIIAQYLSSAKHHPKFGVCSEAAAIGLDCQLTISGEVGVMVTVIVCGMPSDSCCYQVTIPVAAFASMVLLKSFLLRSLNKDPSLAMQLAVRDSTSVADEDRHAQRTGGNQRYECLRVLSDVNHVLSWCTSRYSYQQQMDRDSASDTSDPYYALYVKYCEAAVDGTACETIFGPLDVVSSPMEETAGKKRTSKRGAALTLVASQKSHICRKDDIQCISACGHVVCHLCLLRHLVVLSYDSK